jgi:hypothetical protein
MDRPHARNSDAVEGVGCAWALLAINAVLMGLCAVSFVRGPYSSIEQELWYRYGSLGFLLAGAALPAFALFRGRPRWLVYSTAPWMMISLLGFAGWIMMSGGGV